MRARWLLPLLALPLAGCAARMERAAVQRAAYDFHCPADGVTVEEKALGEYRATGCGQQADYQVIGECYFDWNVCNAQPLARRTPGGKVP